jgi:hypothetical protein
MENIQSKANGQLLDPLIEKNITFNNWVLPSQTSIEKEYNVEYKHHIINIFGELWPTPDDFTQAVNNAIVISLSKEDDFHVENRSHTKNMVDLVDLVSTYRSWPEFRNMITLKDMIMRFKENNPMTMPIILTENDNYYIMSGNTKLDIAFMMGITPKALIIKI